MADAIEFATESPFWYFLAKRAISHTRDRCATLLTHLTDRAAELAIPVEYQSPKAVAWAALCQLFNTTQPLAPRIRRFAFSQMQLGFGHAFGSDDFVRTGFSRILANIQAPAFPGRSREESIVDSFLANGATLIGEWPSSSDTPFVERLLRDHNMTALGGELVATPTALWTETLAAYRRRRPGWFRRIFRNPNTWLFD